MKKKSGNYMYKKYISFVFLCNIVFTLCWFNVQKVVQAKMEVRPAFELQIRNEEEIRQTSVSGTAREAVSIPRVVEVNVLKSDRMQISDEDYEVLLRIVEAEAGCEDEDGKLLVANVILNRVKNSRFPDTIKDVVFQKEKGTTQFSPVSDGRYYSVTVSDETYEAVERALWGEDISQGALFFAARKSADPNKMKWFDNHLTLLFSYGGHEFFQ